MDFRPCVYITERGFVPGDRRPLIVAAARSEESGFRCAVRTSEYIELVRARSRTRPVIVNERPHRIDRDQEPSPLTGKIRHEREIVQDEHGSERQRYVCRFGKETPTVTEGSYSATVGVDFP